MPKQKIIDSLPDLYKKMEDSAFELEVPKESFVTCSNCSMVCHDESKKAKLVQRAFNEKTKCCTYHPAIPNYLIGGILSDQDPYMAEGQKRVRAKIEKREMVFPMVIAAPNMYSVLYTMSHSNGTFGRAESMICPYYNKGLCSVWKYRESMCATWFCKSSTDRMGKVIWDEVCLYVAFIQTQLAKYAMVEAGINSEELLYQFKPGDFFPFKSREELSLGFNDVEGIPMDDMSYKRLWGEWIGREDEFFIRCYEIVNALSKEEVDNILGYEGEIHRKKIQSMVSQLYNIPKKLIKNKQFQFPEPNEENYRVTLQNIDVAFNLPKPVIDYFDGQKETAEVVDSLDEDEGIELDQELILTLFYHNILVPTTGLKQEQKLESMKRVVPR